jgi:hypothetical protein
MNINNAFPSKYLKSGDVPENDDLLLTIERVSVESVGQDDPEDKPIVYFREVEKGLVLNKTNANTIAGLYGPETDGWTGKRIALYATEVAYQGKMTLSLRVRLKAPTVPAVNGNGAASNDRQRWADFCSEHGVTGEIVKAALAYEKVSEWLVATAHDTPPGTLDEAMRLVKAKLPEAQPF